jgi:peptidoglycan hydrolase-like protein with peptidoglycan-binding domain
LEAKDDNEKANRLKFLANAGLIDNYKVHVLATLPTFLGAAIRDHIITVGDVKNVLHQIGLHADPGPYDDVADEAFRKSSRSGLPPDGYIGPNTYAKLREAWPEHFKKDFLTVREAQNVLAHLVPSLHTGPLNDVADEAFRKEIEKFQEKNKIPVDGYMGSPLTYTKLREAYPNYHE